MSEDIDDIIATTRVINFTSLNEKQKKIILETQYRKQLIQSHGLKPREYYKLTQVNKESLEE